SSRNGEDQDDEAPGSCARNLIHGLVARSLFSICSASGGLHKHEQPTNPTVSTFSSSAESDHKSYRISDKSAVSGHKTRMHARPTRHRRVHYRPDRPLRPVNDETAGVRHDTAAFDAHSAWAWESGDGLRRAL